MFWKSLVFLLALTSQVLSHPTDSDFSDGDACQETPKSSPKKSRKNKEKRIRKQLQNDPYAHLVLRIIKGAEKDKKEARRDENDPQDPFIQDALEASSDMYEKAIATRIWFKKNLKAPDAEKKERLRLLIKSIGGRDDLPEKLQSEVDTLGIFPRNKLWDNLRSCVPKSFHISSLNAKGFFLTTLALGSFAATVADGCSIPPGSYQDTCRDFKVSPYKSSLDPELPNFCKLEMSCQSNEGSWTLNTVYFQEGMDMEKCVTDHGENCGGLFTTRSTPTRLCTSTYTIRSEKERISKESARFATLDCNSQIKPPIECLVGQELFFPRDSHLPSLCRYKVKCSTTTSKKTEDGIDIRHDSTAAQQIYLPPNGKGCLQHSINRVRGSLNGRTSNSPPSYKDEL